MSKNNIFETINTHELADIPIKDWRTREAGFDEWVKDNHPQYEYAGTHDLTLDEFPEVQDFFEIGKTSNILTEHFTVGKDKGPPYMLVPGMYKGGHIDPDDERHFGVYDTKDALDEADAIIHEWFDELKRQEKRSIPFERSLVMDMNKIK